LSQLSRKGDTHDRFLYAIIEALSGLRDCAAERPRLDHLRPVASSLVSSAEPAGRFLMYEGPFVRQTNCIGNAITT